MNETRNEADTEANKSNDDEHKQKRLTGDAIYKKVNPRNSLSDKACHITENIGHRNTTLQMNETANQADTETDESDDDEHEDKRIAGNSTDKGANPRHSRGYKSSYVTQQGCNGDTSVREKHILSS